MHLYGKCSWFGGPNDTGVSPSEGLAFIYDIDDQPDLFLPSQPPGTTGLARRLDPNEYYIACRWDYDNPEQTRSKLLANKALVRSNKTGKEFIVYPADWGPHVDTGRVADISPGLMSALGINTDDDVEVIFPYEEEIVATEPVHPMVVDLSHWDPADDYAKVKRAGIVGCIYKATEGGGYSDPTYVSQQHAAKSAGLKWGAYHFADASNVDSQIRNFMNFACPDPDELFCLDWEDNGGDTMSLANVKKWIAGVEEALGRPGECVVYGGNTIKEHGNGDPVLTSRRLWLCQYGSSAVLPEGYDKYWLWQFTDGVYGPQPHSIDGIGPCDINSYKSGNADQLIKEWATGKAEPIPEPPTPEPPEERIVRIVVFAPADVTVRVHQSTNQKLKDFRRGSRHVKEGK